MSYDLRTTSCSVVPVLENHLVEKITKSNVVVVIPAPLLTLVPEGDDFATFQLQTELSSLPSCSSLLFV